jgi:hypothetical protein
MQQHKNANPATVFAQKLTERNPSEFLSFLTDLIRTINCEEKTDSIVKESNSIFISLINAIVHPWLMKGKESVDDILEGFNKIDEMCGFEGFGEAFGVAILTIGNEMIETSFTVETLENYIAGINTLNIICNGVMLTREKKTGSKKAA